MTTQSHNPDDDLSYYENTLPAVIAGVRRGEKWEYQGILSGDWFAPNNQSMKELFSFVDEAFRVRLAPVPVVKPWDCPADVPGPVCWIRIKRDAPEFSYMGDIQAMIVNTSSRGFEYYTAEPNFIKWHEAEKLAKIEHSTDLKSWSPCVKPEGGK